MPCRLCCVLYNTKFQLLAEDTAQLSAEEQGILIQVFFTPSQDFCHHSVPAVSRTLQHTFYQHMKGLTEGEFVNTQALKQDWNWLRYTLSNSRSPLTSPLVKILSPTASCGWGLCVVNGGVNVILLRNLLNYLHQNNVCSLLCLDWICIL